MTSDHEKPRRVIYVCGVGNIGPDVSRKALIVCSLTNGLSASCEMNVCVMSCSLSRMPTALQAIRHASPLFLPTPTVTFPMTTGAKRNQVLHHVAAELASAFYVMDLQAFHAAALLAPPTVSLQNPDSELLVLFRAQFRPRLLLT